MQSCIPHEQPGKRATFCRCAHTIALVLSAGFVVASLASPAVAERQSEQRLPNVIFIMADDLGYGELGCYGQKWIETPNIDRLAAEGMRFTQHYSGSPVCAPARCTLLTGKHGGHAYIRDNGTPPGRPKKPDQGLFPGQNPIPDDEVTIAELLKATGYATGAMGKWGLGYEGSSGDPTNQGFDLFFGFICQWHAHNHYPRFLWRNDDRVPYPGNDRELSGKTYSQDEFTSEALKFIRGHRNEPFLLYLPFAIPHLSIQVPEPSLAPYRDKIPEEAYAHRGYLKHPHPRAGYAAMISHMDRDIGKIMKLVADLGLDEDTIFIFTSDNGPTYNRLGGSDSDFFDSAAGFRGLKGSIYEGGIRVPMVVRWPGKVPAGTVSDHACYFPDWMPTIMELVGADAKLPKNDGTSFAPTLLGKPQQQQMPKFLYWEFHGYGGQQAVRLGNFKAVRRNVRKGKLNTELYNLAEDPGEAKNVAADHPKLLAEMEEIMRQQHEPSKLFPLPVLDK